MGILSLEGFREFRGQLFYHSRVIAPSFQDAHVNYLRESYSSEVVHQNPPPPEVLENAALIVSHFGDCEVLSSVNLARGAVPGESTLPSLMLSQE